MSDKLSPASIPLDRAPFTFKTLTAIANTEFVPRGLRGKPNAILAAILMGRELGLGPMESMRSISIIDGRPSPSAEWMVGRIFEAGHLITTTTQTDTECTVHGERYRDGVKVTEMDFTFTIGMAERAGLTKKDNWKHYPEAMLYWRAVAQLARQLFPDVLSGVKHTPEELVPDQLWDAYGVIPEEEDLAESEGEVTDEDGNLIEDAEVVDVDEVEVADAEVIEMHEWRPEPSGEDDRVAINRVRQYVDSADLWVDLIGVIEHHEQWMKGTVPDIQAELRFMFRAMEAVGLWQGAHTLHDELRRAGKAHLGDFIKADLTSWGRTMVTKAAMAVSHAKE